MGSLLNGQAFRKTASKHPWRIELLYLFKGIEDSLGLSVKPFRDRFRISLQVSRIIHQIDQMDADQSAHWIHYRHVQLFQKMVLERGCGA